jgi:hypothetical protein
MSGSTLHVFHAAQSGGAPYAMNVQKKSKKKGCMSAAFNDGK